MVNNFLKNSRSLLLRRQNNILSAASVLMVAVFLSRILGLLRDRFLAGAFFDLNTAWQLDVYFAAFRLPDMIFQLLVVGALSAAFIPVFTDYLVKDKKQAWRLASTIITLGTILFFIFAIILIIFAKPLSQLIAPSFSPIEIVLMTNLTRLLVVAQGAFVISNFLTGILQSHRHFIIPALSPIAYNLGIIFGILTLSSRFGIYGPALGVLIGALLHLVVQLPLIKKVGFIFRPSINIKDAGVRRIGRLMLPRTLALAVSQIELTVAVFIATSLSSGSLAVFYFAQHLNALPVGLFGATIGQAALPTLSREYNLKSLEKFKSLFLSSLQQTLFLSLPAGMMLLVLRIPAVRLAFGTRNFPWEATLLTGKVVALFALSVFAQSAIQILVRGFYAIGNTKTPFFIGASAVILNVFLSFFFVYSLDLNVLGLALAISLSSFFHAGFLMLFFSKLLGGFSKKDLLFPFIKMSIATIITGVFLWIPLRVLDRYILNTAKTIDLIILVIITSTIGLFVYIFLSKLLKIKELDNFIDLIKRAKNLSKVLSQTKIALKPASGSELSATRLPAQAGNEVKGSSEPSL
ncbi:MAG: murein biosynthesis integral membrane protein MurJ [Candidatus Beckwithbacteria bacterium]|nr:murein biosynthesis integral membrane protein MurJ [Patescibacteria group bacterium]